MDAKYVEPPFKTAIQRIIEGVQALLKKTWTDADKRRCSRKYVCAAAMTLVKTTPNAHGRWYWNVEWWDDAQNGPSGSHPCSGETGNCGCAHAEPRLIDKLRESIATDAWWTAIPSILICRYSPCSQCANRIVDQQPDILQMVVYDEVTTHDMRGLQILAGGGVAVFSTEELRIAIKELDMRDRPGHHPIGTPKYDALCDALANLGSSKR